MASPEDEAKQAALRFYQSLDDLLLGRGSAGVQSTWWHDESVTTVHPFGHWSRGWKEVLATFEEVGALFSYYRGHADRTEGIGGIHDLQVAVRGATAYSIGVYKSVLYHEGKEVPLCINCTNVLESRGGVWKLVHHHPDQAPPDYQSFVASLLG